MSALGVAKYDHFERLELMSVKIKEALDEFRKKWKTLDMDEIMRKIRVGLVRELQQIDERKFAKEYALKRPKSLDLLNEDLGLGSVNMSQGASSPSKYSPSPIKNRSGMSPMKTGERDGLNNTGLALRSIGGSSDGGRNRSIGFKEPSKN